MAAGVRPGTLCCREGTPDYEKATQKARDFACKDCPIKPQLRGFDSWFFHIRELARRQRAGIQLTYEELTDHEIEGLAAWNEFHHWWGLANYRTIPLDDKALDNGHKDS